MQTRLISIVILICLLMAGCGSSNTSLETATPLETPTFVPSPTLSPTPTKTPTPTETIISTPTETPGPMWELGQFGDFPHAINDNGQETFNFLQPLEQYPRLPDISPKTIQAYHQALKTIRLSDGSPLVKSMNTQEFNQLPDIDWSIHKHEFRDIVWYGNSNVGDATNPPHALCWRIHIYLSGL